MKHNFKLAMIGTTFSFLCMSCQKECIIEDTYPEKNEANKTEMLSFSSRESLESTIDGHGLLTKSNSTVTLKDNLLSSLEGERFFSDSILNVECSMLEVSSISAGGSVFDILGYNELVPNKSFASLLNYRGEIEVRDTVYKVSPKGTYYFHKSLLKDFESNYRDIVLAELRLVRNGTYIVVLPNSGTINEQVYLKDTFGNSCEVMRDGLNENTSETNTYPKTKAVEDERWKEALNIDWNSLDKHYTDAHTWAGELIEGVIGRNVSFEKEFDSKHRLKAKLYYYDYAVYSEIGALSKMQKKNRIGWSETDAQKIYQIWSNMVIWTPFQKTVQYPHVNQGSTIPREYIGTNVEDIPGTGKQGVVSYFAGRDLSEQELSRFASNNYVNSVIDLKINVERDRLDSRTMAAKYITEKGIYTIIYPYGKMEENKGEIQSKFSKDFHIFIGLDLSGGSLPQDFKGWLQAAQAEQLKVPELIQGEMMTAAIYNGDTKGMRLIKKNED